MAVKAPSDSELMAIWLNSGEKAAKLSEAHKTVASCAAKSEGRLRAAAGLSAADAFSLAMLPKFTRLSLADGLEIPPRDSGERIYRRYFVDIFTGCLTENAAVISYSGKSRASVDFFSGGTAEMIGLNFPLLAKAALQHKADAVVIAHNHPGGTCEPSRSDIAVTRRLFDAFEQCGILLKDHYIATVNDAKAVLRDIHL